MSTDCSTDKKELNSATVVADREKMKRGTDDIISDDELFTQPPNKDCPICLLRLPSLSTGSAYYECCGKMICSGCACAPVKDNRGKVINEKKCPSNPNPNVLRLMMQCFT